MATPVSAKNAKIRSGAGATTITAKKWTVRMEADELDTSNFEGAGFKDRITGLIGCDVTVELDLDAAVNYFEATPGWVPGTTVATLKLYLNDTSGSFWDFPSVRFISCDVSADVKGLLTASYSFKTKGTFTDPTGTFT
jgi:hypothetical protein